MGKHPASWRMSIILNKQSRISAEATAELLELIEPLQDKLQYYIANTLRKPSTELSESAISRLREFSKHPEETVRIVAVTAFSSRSNLLSDEIQFLQTLLRSRDTSSRIYAARALEEQRNLPDEVITGLVSLIQDRMGGVASAAVDALIKRSDLPKDVTQGLASMLSDLEWGARTLVIKILENQSEISRDVANVFISRLRPVDHDGCRVSRKIAEEPTLLGKILEGLGLPLRPQKSASASTLSPSLEDIESLYGCFLYRSFEEHFWMQVNDDKTLTIHQPSGTRIVALEIDSTDIFLNWRKNWEAAAMNCDTCRFNKYQARPSPLLLEIYL
ncbi:hypothetical protein GGS24DRAFT_513710 [Hypoxylon argillaceum]|nr:hypothetical protein GGS24DRAFT_513710 [Hypoxylon argillaceum]